MSDLAARPRLHRSVPARGAQVALLAVAAALLVAPAAHAGGYLESGKPASSSRPTWAVPGERVPVEGEGEDARLAQLENARMRVQEAQQNQATAEWTYTRARTRRYPRGDALQEIINRVVEMNRERAEAETEFVALVEQARQAGVPAGPLSPYMDLADEIRRNPAPTELPGSLDEDALGEAPPAAESQSEEQPDEAPPEQ